MIIVGLTIVRELDNSLRLEMYVSGEDNPKLLSDSMFNTNQEIGDVTRGYPPTCIYFNKAKMTSYAGILNIKLTGLGIIPEERKIKLRVEAPFKIEDHLADGTVYQKPIESELIFKEKDITIHNIIKKGV